MALGGNARPLLVPSADVLVKNMRAIESARAASASPAHPSASSDAVSPTLLMGLGAVSEHTSRHSPAPARFGPPQPGSAPNPVVAFLSRIFASKKKDDQEKHRLGDKSHTHPPESKFQKALIKILPLLEQASQLLSPVPHPLVFYLASVLVVLVVNRLRPHWFDSIMIAIAFVAMFLPILAIAMIWHKTELFSKLRDGNDPFTHPLELRLDAVEANLTQREQKMKEEEEQLRNERDKVDELRKELAKDVHAHDSDSIIMPSRKAAEMIANGALGAGYDQEAAQAVEAKRKEESVKKSREEWHQRAAELDRQPTQTNETLKLMADHAGKEYTRRTRELKTRNSGNSPKATDKFVNFTKSIHHGKKDKDQSRRTSRYSERSLNSNTSRKRRGFFGRSRRATDGTNAADEGWVPSTIDRRLAANDADMQSSS